MNCFKFLDIKKYSIPYDQFDVLDKKEHSERKYGGRKVLFHKHKKQEMLLQFINYDDDYIFKAEFLSLSLLDNDNIVKYLAWTEIGDVRGIVTEFMAGGSLHNVIYSENKYEVANILWWNIQTARALEYIHEHEHYHLNYRPENILLDKSLLNVKLSGFENCRKICTGYERSFDYAIPEQDLYMAPEILLPFPWPSIKCDVYSWAMVFWECFNRETPFKNERSTGMSVNEINKLPKRLLKDIEDVPEIINDIVQKSIRIDANERTFNISLIKKELESILNDNQEYGTPKSLAFHEANESMRDSEELVKKFIEFGLFETRGELGSGSFGEVQLVFHKIKKKEMAIKTLTITKRTGEPNFKKEFFTMTKLNHENIVKLLGWTQVEDEKAIIMEYMEGGNLDSVIYSKNGKIHYSSKEILSWSIQAASALEYMHDPKNGIFMHKDVKPGNMLLDKTFTILKLCDFGFSRPTTGETSVNPHLYEGTRIYMAPEVLNNERHGPKADVYSWALSFWECFTKTPPFEVELDGKINRAKFDPDYRLPDVEHMEFNTIIQKCSHHSQEERYSMGKVSEILKQLIENENSIINENAHLIERDSTKIWYLGYKLEETKPEKMNLETKFENMKLLDEKEDIDEIDDALSDIAGVSRPNKKEETILITNNSVFSCNDLNIGSWDYNVKFPSYNLRANSTSINETIYLCGGEDGRDERGYIKYSNELIAYSTISGEYKYLKPMKNVSNIPICQTFSVEEKSYILAVETSSNHSVQLYDIEKDTWRTAKSLENTNLSLKLVGMKNSVMETQELFMPNVQNSSTKSNENNMQKNTVHSYILDQDTWITLESPSNFYTEQYGLAYHKGQVYIMNSKSFERYDPAEKVWHRIPQLLDPNRPVNALLSFKGNLWAILESNSINDLHVVKMFDERNKSWLSCPSFMKRTNDSLYDSYSSWIIA